MGARQSRLKGAAWMIGATAAFALMDAGMKQLAAHYPPLEVATVRGAASLPVVFIWAVFAAGPGSLLASTWWVQLVRTVLFIATTCLFVRGIDVLPLSNAYALFFTAPVIAALLGVLMLGDRMSGAFASALGLAALGAMVALRPTTDGLLTIASLGVLGAAFAHAVTCLLVRVYSATDSPQAMAFWVLAGLTLGVGAWAWPQWVPVRAEHLGVVALVGLAGAFGQIAITFAFAREATSLVAVFQYTGLLWAVIADISFWQIWPQPLSVVGMLAVAVAGGILLFERQASGNPSRVID
jgi:drug/metabolite transporter (DMT)-like permease